MGHRARRKHRRLVSLQWASSLSLIFELRSCLISTQKKKRRRRRKEEGGISCRRVTELLLREGGTVAGGQPKAPNSTVTEWHRHSEPLEPPTPGPEPAPPGSITRASQGQSPLDLDSSSSPQTLKYRPSCRILTANSFTVFVHLHKNRSFYIYIYVFITGYTLDS